MSEAYRGGNARLLARQLDQLLWPVVVLDQRLQIVFVSASLCRLLNVDASELVGLECVAELTKDESPEPELAMMLAPPADVLHGKAAFRQVPWPPRARTKSSSAPLNQPVNQPPTQPSGHAPAQPPTHSPSHGSTHAPAHASRHSANASASSSSDASSREAAAMSAPLATGGDATTPASPPLTNDVAESVVHSFEASSMIDDASTVSQAFIPIIDDDDASSGLILVLFGRHDSLRTRLSLFTRRESGSEARSESHAGQAGDEVLLRLRHQWQQLDGLWPLFGVSPSIQLAMRRAQLACQSNVGVYIYGPRGSAKGELAKSIAMHRTKASPLAQSSLALLALDCELATDESIGSALDSFAARLRPATATLANHLILEKLDRTTPSVLKAIFDWLEDNGASCCVFATAELPPAELSQRSPLLERIVQRASTLEIAIPPLAHRREDIPALAQHHLAFAAARAQRRLPGISPAALELLQAYPWTGNAMELRQVAGEMLTNAVLTATIQPTHLPLQLRTFAGTISQSRSIAEPISLDEVLVELERVMLARAMKLSPRNRARAARMLGISRPRFLRRIAQLGLDGGEQP